MYTKDYKPQPKKYGKLKKKILKKLLIYRRKIHDVIENKKYAKQISFYKLEHQIFKHQSLLLRKLKDIDMYLQTNKIVNLRLATDKINGIIILPNETFSVWKLVGNPTKRKGYIDGLILSNGKVSKGTAGGLCQLGNLIYWMALHSPLTVTERWRHSYDVFPDVNRKLPFGSGATLSYNYVDLQLFNPTDYKIQINVWLSDNHLCGSINTSKKTDTKYHVFEQEHKIVSQWWGGYTRHNTIYRKIKKKNKEEITEFVTENHAVMMYSPLLEANTM